MEHNFDKIVELNNLPESERFKKNKDYRRKFIIHDSSFGLDVFNIAVTTLAWLVALFCFRDVIYAIFDIETDVLYEHLPAFIQNANLIHRVSAVEPPREVLLKIVIFIVIIIVAELAWIGYNLYAFGGKDRRKKRPLMPKEDVIKLYNIDEEKYAVFQKGKNLSVGFDENLAVKSVRDLAEDSVDKN